MPGNTHRVLSEKDCTVCVLQLVFPLCKYIKRPHNKDKFAYLRIILLEINVIYPACLFPWFSHFIKTRFKMYTGGTIFNPGTKKEMI